MASFDKLVLFLEDEKDKFQKDQKHVKNKYSKNAFFALKV